MKCQDIEIADPFLASGTSTSRFKMLKFMTDKAYTYAPPLIFTL